MVSLRAFVEVSGSYMTSNIPALLHHCMVDNMTWHLRFPLIRVRILVADLEASSRLFTLARSACQVSASCIGMSQRRSLSVDSCPAPIRDRCCFCCACSAVQWLRCTGYPKHLSIYQHVVARYAPLHATRVCTAETGYSQRMCLNSSYPKTNQPNNTTLVYVTHASVACNWQLARSGKRAASLRLCRRPYPNVGYTKYKVLLHNQLT